MTAEEIDKEFYKFWNGGENHEGAGRVYSYVDPGTARALFAEGWVRAEEREQRQKKGEEMEPRAPKFNLEQLSDYMLHKLEQEILIIKTTRAMRAQGLLPAKPKIRRSRTKKPLSGPTEA